MKKNKLISYAIIVAILISVISIKTTDTYAKDRVIRVGYDQDSHFIQKKNDEYYGYGVEYLNKIAEYTGWTYEYVTVTSWSDTFQKLRDKEIDLICTAHYTEEHAQEFLYSSIPFGYETTLLYTHPDRGITYQDHDALENSRVGLLLESYSSMDFLNHAEEYGLNYEVVYYESKSAMRLALDNGEIDFFAIGSRYAASSLSLFERLNANAFYCITNKSNPELISEIETVIQQIMFDAPNFEGDLNAKYFGHDSLSSTPLFNKDELEFIKNSEVIMVNIPIEQRPSCYLEDDVFQGIWPEYLKLISEKSGLKFEIDNNTYDDNVKENQLFLRTSNSISHSNSNGIIISSPLMDVQLSYVGSKAEFVNNNSDNHIIAITRDLSYIAPLIIQANSNYQIIYYDNAEECFDAVIENEADIAIQNNFRTSYLMQKPKYADNLVQFMETDYNNEMRLVANENQELLISIINKTISHISEEEKDTIVKKELLLHPYVFNFSDIWYKYWEWIILAAVVIVIAVIVYTIATQRMAKLKMDKHENEILRHKLQLDEITDLYNRTYFFEIAQEMINDSKEEMCIVTMNISNFKIINELYGMPVGDKVLLEIAKQLKTMYEKYNVILARFTSDHYYMCMPKRIFDIIDFSQTYKTFLDDVDIRVIYGVYLIAPGTSLPVNVMCDKALVAAREKINNYVDYVHFYNDVEHKQRLMEQEIENDMEKALVENHFYIQIQPKIHSQTKKIVGGESLVRWKHPEKGFISPGAFIPVFEKTF